MGWGPTQYLRFPDEATWQQLAGLLDDRAVAVRGTLYAPMPDDADPETYEPAALEGYHVDFRLPDGAKLPDELVQYLIVPNHPMFGFAE